MVHLMAAPAAKWGFKNTAVDSSGSRDDERLLEKIAKGNHPAFAELVRRHTNRFYRLAYRFTGHPGDAEDIVQEAFLRLWAKPASWNASHGAAFTTWFYRIVVNLCLDRQRKNRNNARALTSLVQDPTNITAAPDVEMEEREKWLEAGLADLPERQRIAIHLCFIDDLSNREAAEIMKINVKALQSLVMRAKAALKNKLKKEGE